jgi:hypothetical protein
VAEIHFVASQQPDGSERIELCRQRNGGLFRKASSEIISRADWVRSAPAAGMAALSRLRSLPGADAVLEDDLGLTVPVECIAPLTEHEAHALGLPPATDLTLQLQSSGSLHEGSIAVSKKWVKRGGVPVRAKVVGGRIREPNGTSRLPEPLFSTNLLVDNLGEATDDDERRARFAVLRERLGDMDDQAVQPDGFIAQVRIAYAANFSLDLRTHGGLFDFDPVLFARSMRENEDGDLIDAKSAALLTEHEQHKFKSRFRSQKGGKRSYLLSDGTILYLDPLLGKALDIVREMQTAPGDERRDFARSPQAHIRERLALDESGDDEAADRLFIETQQYSQRVAGIETWQKPVLPWVKPTSNSWLPERFGIRIGDEPDVVHIELEPGDAEKLVVAIDTAIDRGERSTPFKGEAVPANPAARAAVQNIADLEVEIAHQATSGGDEKGPGAELPTYFLKVGENFETLEYSRLADPSAPEENFAAPAIPALVRSVPKAHQVDAFHWLVEAWSRKTPGVLLADDMGLGKTFEALTFLTWLRTIEAAAQPVLIVAPTGLLRNWLAEISLHLEPGALGSIIEAFGSNMKFLRCETGNDIRGGTSKLDVAGWKDAGIVLTTFETMRDYHMSFARVPFSAIIYDEIQKLKNPASQMTRAAKTLNARIQVGMTGTPVENRLQDLWSISDVVFPGFLGSSREFESGYSADDAEALGSLQSKLIERDGASPPFMLRRMKDGLLTGLPAKQVVTYDVEMPVEQSDAYDRVLARARALRQSGDKGAMLKILHMLRGTSLHPSPPVGVGNFDAYVRASARLTKTFALLEEIQAKREKALIFCEDLDMQAFLAIAAQERFGLRRPISVINGSVAGEKRQAIVSDFQSRPPGFDVMILSPKAGGVGLTITAANHVIHLSRWWNPAVEDQATDRVYRIGQERPVTVHIPMAVHPDAMIGPSSFDVRLNRLMERKRELSRGLLVPPESGADIDEMLSAVLDGATDPRPDESEPSVDVGEPDMEGVASSGDPGHPALPDPESGTKSGGGAPIAQYDGDNKALRPVLSVRDHSDHPSLSPIEAAEARVPEIRRVVFEVGGLRDWSIFTQYIKSKAISSMQIIDPYCCANEGSRRRLADFVARFASEAGGISSVHIVSFHANVFEDNRETGDEQRRDLATRLANKVPSATFRYVQKSRRSAEDIHDRSVSVVLENGDTIIWDLGRGIDGVMTAKYACTVNAYRQPTAGTGWN